MRNAPGCAMEPPFAKKPRAMADFGSDTKGDTALKTKVIPKVARPPLHKVILLNDDFTPREFVVRLLKAEFRVPEPQAHKIMMTAHQKGACVVAVFTREVAETKATRATDAARSKGYPLLFTTEPEE